MKKRRKKCKFTTKPEKGYNNKTILATLWPGLKLSIGIR